MVLRINLCSTGTEKWTISQWMAVHGNSKTSIRHSCRGFEPEVQACYTIPPPSMCSSMHYALQTFKVNCTIRVVGVQLHSIENTYCSYAFMPSRLMRWERHINKWCLVLSSMRTNLSMTVFIKQGTRWTAHGTTIVLTLAWLTVSWKCIRDAADVRLYWGETILRKAGDKHYKGTAPQRAGLNEQ